MCWQPTLGSSERYASNIHSWPFESPPGAAVEGLLLIFVAMMYCAVAVLWYNMVFGFHFQFCFAWFCLLFHLDVLWRRE